MTAVFTINWSMCRILQNACSSCRWSGGVTSSCSEYAIFFYKIVRILRPCLRDSVSVYCNPKMIKRLLRRVASEGTAVSSACSDCSSCHMESLIAHGLCRSGAGLQHCSTAAARMQSGHFWVCWELKQGALLHPSHCTAQWHSQWWQLEQKLT